MFALIGPHFAIPFEFEFLEQIYSSMDGRSIVSIGPISSAINPNRDTRPSIWPLQEGKKPLENIQMNLCFRSCIRRLLFTLSRALIAAL